MALKALDIFKLLPKTNCKKCGCPTCLAFAMKLAQKQASLDQCPDVSAAAKSELEGSAAPPIRLITVGAGAKKLEVGNETVMFRHEESFYHGPGIGVRVPDTLDAAALAATVQRLSKLQFTRVGMHMGIGLVAVENVSGKADAFAAAAAAVSKIGLPMALIATQAGHIDGALAACAGARALIHAATDENWEAFAKVAKARECPLAVRAADLDKLAALTEKIKAAGVQDLVLDLTAAKLSDTVQALTAVRRLALKKGLRALGYPCLVRSAVTDPLDGVAECCTAIAKYAAIVLTPLAQAEQLLPMLTLAQNIYTDPRKPIQVEAKLYEVGAVTPESPLMITTNFSLTYYTVEGEVESSRVPAYILVVDTEGTSVLTAFASDKLTAEKVAGLLKSDAIARKVSHRKVIIPGYISVMSGGLQDESGWQVMVGPREASGIPKYLKTVWKAG